MIDNECSSNFVHILIGNKIDVTEERKLTVIEGHDLAQDLGMDRYIEICAIRNLEIKSTIDDLLLRLKEKNVQNKRFKDSVSLETGTITTYNNRVSGSIISPLTDKNNLSNLSIRSIKSKRSNN